MKSVWESCRLIALGLMVVGSSLGVAHANPDPWKVEGNMRTLRGKIVVGDKTYYSSLSYSVRPRPVPLDERKAHQVIDTAWTKIQGLAVDRAQVVADLDAANSKVEQSGWREVISNLEVRDRELADSSEQVADEAANLIKKQISVTEDGSRQQFVKEELAFFDELSLRLEKGKTRADDLYARRRMTAFDKARANCLAESAEIFSGKLRSSFVDGLDFGSVKVQAPSLRVADEVVSFQANCEEVGHLLVRILQPHRLVLRFPADLHAKLTMKADAVTLQTAVDAICREVGASLSIEGINWTIRRLASRTVGNLQFALCGAEKLSMPS